MENTKFKRTELPRIRQELIIKQNGICPICNGDLTRTKVTNLVIDHDHKTGIVRAVVHRGCNGIEGKVLRLMKTWGRASSMREVIYTLENLIVFWKWHSKPRTHWIYYNFKTEAEKRFALNKKRRLAAKKRRKKNGKE